jgi:hypothetical protein
MSTRLQAFVTGFREKIGKEADPHPPPQSNALVDPRANAPLPPLIFADDVVKKKGGPAKAIQSLMSWIGPQKRPSVSKPWHGDDVDYLKKVVRLHLRTEKLAVIKAHKVAAKTLLASGGDESALVSKDEGVLVSKKKGRKGKKSDKVPELVHEVPDIPITDIPWKEIEKEFCDGVSSLHQRTAVECYQKWGDLQNNERLRVLAPDGEERFFAEPELITSEDFIIDDFRRQPSKCSCVELFEGGSGLGSAFRGMEHLLEGTQWSRVKSAKLHLGKARIIPKPGSKLNPKRGSSSKVPLVLRGVSIQQLEAFHVWSSGTGEGHGDGGTTSRTKIDSIIYHVPPHLSYAEWVLGDRQQR